MFRDGPLTVACLLTSCCELLPTWVYKLRHFYRSGAAVQQPSLQQREAMQFMMEVRNPTCQLPGKPSSIFLRDWAPAFVTTDPFSAESLHCTFSAKVPVIFTSTAFVSYGEWTFYSIHNLVPQLRGMIHKTQCSFWLCIHLLSCMTALQTSLYLLPIIALAATTASR